MKKQVPKIIVLMGPTASGKSGAAIKLAQKFDGEIISADSRQIYVGLDVGSGKVKKDSGEKNAYFSEGIVHHLIDVAKPMEDFNISHFKTLANKAIKEILAKGKIPIICGGTAFWIDSITNNTTFPEVVPDIKLRQKLEAKATEELFSQLKKLDPERAKNIDSKNKVRLIRAIEICQTLGTVPRINKNKSTDYEFLQIGLKIEREKLNEKIKKRLEERFDEGMISEVEKLHNSGVSWEWMERIGLEYRWIARYLQKQIQLEEMKEKLYFDIIHYAKRQMTWLKRNQEIVWFEEYSKIEELVAKFIQNK